MQSDQAEDLIDRLEIYFAERLAAGDPESLAGALAMVIQSGLVRRMDDHLIDRGMSLSMLFEMLELGTEFELQRANVVKLSRFGYTPQAVADLLGLAVIDVEQYLVQYSPHGASPDVIRMHLDGARVVDIVSALDVGRNTVYKILKEAGLIPHKSIRRSTPEQRELILELSAQGLSHRQVAEKLGLEVHDVKNTLYLHRKREARMREARLVVAS